MLSHAAFEKLAAEALNNLPSFFQEKMSNVELLIELWPSRDALKQAGVPPNHTLLGLYSGIPLTKRTIAYSLVPPDTITLYQGPIEAKAGGVLEEIRRTVRHTIIHELAHHFGISDERLRDLGAY